MSNFILVIQDHESYCPEAWGPFGSADLAEDYINYLDPRPDEDDCQVVLLHGIDD